jgi:hypothetical protein
MSVILVDLGDEKHDIMVNNAGWRSTVEVLQPFGLIDDERMQRLATAWPGVRLTQAEAQAIGDALVTGPLSAIDWSNNVYPPAGYWKDALDKKPREYETDTYWPSWLRAFAAFCLTCKGFIVY